MAELLTSREVARPVIDALKEAFLLDDLQVHSEVRGTATGKATREIIVWFAVSIFSHAEILRLAEIVNATRSKGTILPDDKSQMRIELAIPAPAA